MVGFLPRYFLITPSAIAKGISDTYVAWLLGLINGLSVIGRVGIGVFADRQGQVRALAASSIFCGLGHVILGYPEWLFIRKAQQARARHLPNKQLVLVCKDTLYH